MLLRNRQLIADGAPIELGTRAFDLLLVLLEANGSLVTKDELMSRVWPGVVVAGENLKVQIYALRKALGEDRGFIRTVHGRGYRFIPAVHSTVAWAASAPDTTATGRVKGLVLDGFFGDRRAAGVQGRPADAGRSLIRLSLGRRVLPGGLA